MRIITELDKPDDVTVKCMLCGQDLFAKYHWIDVVNKWLRPSCHDKCVEAYEIVQKNKREGDHGSHWRKIPEEFQGFELDRFDHPEALRSASQFLAESKYQILAIIGPPGGGKSRLAWETIRMFFEEGSGWVEHAVFADLMLDFDRSRIQLLQSARYAFIDDIGASSTLGRERASLQNVIRSRLSAQRWTFMTIDDLSFDDFDTLLKGRAHVIYVK